MDSLYDNLGLLLVMSWVGSVIAGIVFLIGQSS